MKKNKQCTLDSYYVVETSNNNMYLGAVGRQNAFFHLHPMSGKVTEKLQKSRPSRPDSLKPVGKVGAYNHVKVFPRYQPCDTPNCQLTNGGGVHWKNIDTKTYHCNKCKENKEE